MRPLPWGERHAGRLEHELAALDAAGIGHVRDEQAWAGGVCQLELSVPVAGRAPMTLTAVFPDDYPHYRPLVLMPAPARVEFSHHVHPFSGEVCLLDRDGDAWWPYDDTLAGLLAQQLPRALALGDARVDDTEPDESIAAGETRQAEPFSAYYPYAEAAAVLVDGSWQVPTGQRCGPLTVRFAAASPRPGGLPLLGLLAEIAGEDGVIHAQSRLAHAVDRFPHPVPGRWVRLDAPVVSADPYTIAAAVGDHDSRALQEWTPLGDRDVQVVGVVFPEERAWRDDYAADGWLFLVRERVQPAGRRDQRGAGSRAARGTAPDEGRLWIVRADYAGPAELAMRVPELRGLADHSAAVIGLGALGGYVVAHLASAGVGGLTLMDGDVIEAATLPRHAAGLEHVGWPKTQAAADLALRHNPYIDIRQLSGRLGVPRPGGVAADSPQLLADALSAVDVIIDATADAAVHRHLADIAEQADVPLVVVTATPGAWGGRIVTLPAAAGGCWYCLLRHLPADDAQKAAGSPLSPPEGHRALVQSAGCAYPTFTGSGFDLAEVSLHAVRIAVGVLQAVTAGGYPRPDGDVFVLALRDSAGRALPGPIWQAHPLPPHPDCAGSHG